MSMRIIPGAHHYSANIVELVIIENVCFEKKLNKYNELIVFHGSFSTLALY